MKEWILVIAAIAVLGGGSAVAYFVMNKSGADSTKDAPLKQTVATGKFKEACKVVSAADASAAFGVTYKEGVDEGNSLAPGNVISRSCKYNEVNDGSATALLNAINFSVEFETYNNAELAKAALKRTKETEKTGSKVYFVRTDVAGVGDEAFFFQGQAPGVLKTEEYMYARKNNQIFHFVAVRIDGIDHAKAQAAITTLAKKALD